MAGQWFSSGTLVSSTNKTDLHDITDNFVESSVKHHKP
jgi:cobalamin-dependent methionine synthase I